MISLISIFTIIDFIIIFILSLVLNTFIFSVIKLGLLGIPLRNKLNILLEYKINLITIVIFFLSLSILIYLNFNFIYLDNKDVIVTTYLKNEQFVISGNALNVIFNNIGSAGVFTAGARIAATLVAKHPMHLLPKTGIIGGVGAGFTITFKLITNLAPIPSDNNTVINTGPIEIKLEGLNFAANKQPKSTLEQFFSFPSEVPIKLDKLETIKKIQIKGNTDETNTVISELNKQNPNWKDELLNSPLENGDPINQYLIDNLTNNLYLHFIMSYLLVMLIIIIACKLMLNENIQFIKIRKYPLGNFISNILTKYITIWQSSNNIWIFLLLFSLTIFTLASTYSIYQILIVLK